MKYVSLRLSLLLSLQLTYLNPISHTPPGHMRTRHASTPPSRHFPHPHPPYPTQHPELDQMICEHHDVPGQDLECYFASEGGSLWFVYANGACIQELLRDTVIQSLERAYAKACQEEADADALDSAISRYESKHYETL